MRIRRSAIVAVLRIHAFRIDVGVSIAITGSISGVVTDKIRRRYFGRYGGCHRTL